MDQRALGFLLSNQDGETMKQTRRPFLRKNFAKPSQIKRKRSFVAPLTPNGRWKRAHSAIADNTSNTCEKHVFCAHPTQLHSIACLYCGKEAYANHDDSLDTKLLKYLSSRRKLRMLENLWSLLVPIHTISALLTNQVLKAAGVVSNKGCLHLTLLEGVPEDQCFDLKTTILALWKHPTLTMDSIQALPTIDESKKLVVVSVTFSSPKLRSSLAHTQTHLPQWPLHVALGTISTESLATATQELENQLVGKNLSILPEQVKWFPPKRSNLLD